MRKLLTYLNIPKYLLRSRKIFIRTYAVRSKFVVSKYSFSRRKSKREKYKKLLRRQFTFKNRYTKGIRLFIGSFPFSLTSILCKSVDFSFRILAIELTANIRIHSPPSQIDVICDLSQNRMRDDYTVVEIDIRMDDVCLSEYSVFVLSFVLQPPVEAKASCLQLSKRVRGASLRSELLVEEI